MIGSQDGGCTQATCPVENGFLSEPPSLEGTVIILALFAALVPVQLWIGARCRTATYSLVLVLGLAMDVVGFLGRLLLRSNLASKTYFLLFLLGSTTGPTLIAAAIFATLPHVFSLYGSDMSLASKPVWLSNFFLIFDVSTVIFQALGSAFAAEGYDKLQMQQGVNLLIAGMILQLASIILAFIVYYMFMRRVVQNRNFLDPRFSDIYLSTRFKTATLCIQSALALILIRTVARIVQLCSGMDSTLSQSQIYIPVLDGALVLFAVGFLTVMPPGVAFGRAWGVTSPSNTKARRSSAALYPGQDISPGSSLRPLHGRSISSPQAHARYGLASAKEPRSPPPTVTAHNADIGEPAAGSNRRFPLSWARHKRQQSADSTKATEIPPYERPAQNYTRVPYMPPQSGSLSQQYGHGAVVESQVVIAEGGGSRAGGLGSGGAGRKARQSPRAYEEDLVRHDSIW
ncbi:unnamed protein product [Discula destructiva]